MITDLLDIESANILVIDDEAINLEIIEELLSNYGYKQLHLFSDAEEGIAFYRQTPPDLVLLDINMPVLSGFDVLQRFAEIKLNLMPPVIVITALNDEKNRLQALSLGAKDFLTKPFCDEEVLLRVHNLLEMFLAHKENSHYASNLEQIVEKRTEDLLATQQEMIERLGLAAEYRDNDTAAHTIRVGRYVETIALGLGLNAKKSKMLRFSAPMHDMGKVGIPDNILLKPGKLDDGEWEIMKKHAEYGYDILKNSSSLILKNAGVIALSHHEKWNGKGYPSGLKADQIPLYGRITAAADVFDALMMSRPYKPAWSLDRAVALINEEAGQHFDPSIVKVFNQVIDQLVLIKEEYAD